MPDNGNKVFSINICSTVILLNVSVPVLSEQIYVTEPSVSTAGNFLISALSFTSFFAPSARDIVTTAGNASGIAATARDIAVSSINSIGSPRNTPKPKIIAHITRTAMASFLPNVISLLCKGVFTSSSP